MNDDETEPDNPEFIYPPSLERDVNKRHAALAAAVRLCELQGTYDAAHVVSQAEVVYNFLNGKIMPVPPH